MDSCPLERPQPSYKRICPICTLWRQHRKGEGWPSAIGGGQLAVIELPSERTCSSPTFPCPLVDMPMVIIGRAVCVFPSGDVLSLRYITAKAIFDWLKGRQKTVGERKRLSASQSLPLARRRPLAPKEKVPVHRRLIAELFLHLLHTQRLPQHELSTVSTLSVTRRVHENVKRKRPSERPTKRATIGASEAAVDRQSPVTQTAGHQHFPATCN